MFGISHLLKVHTFRRSNSVKPHFANTQHQELNNDNTLFPPQNISITISYLSVSLLYIDAKCKSLQSFSLLKN